MCCCQSVTQIDKLYIPKQNQTKNTKKQNQQTNFINWGFHPKYWYSQLTKPVELCLLCMHFAKEKSFRVIWLSFIQQSNHMKFCDFNQTNMFLSTLFTKGLFFYRWWIESYSMLQKPWVRVPFETWLFTTCDRYRYGDI